MESIREGSHISPDMLAEYALGRLPQRDAPVVFEHLLVCDECNERYESELTFRKDLAAAEALNAREAPAEVKQSWLGWLAIPKPAWAAVAALAVFAAFLPMLRQDSSSPVQMVELSAMRGEEATAIQSGSRLELRLDRTGLQSPPAQVRVQIVDDSGSEVWTGTGTTSGSQWLVRPDRSLSAGQYWVRVYNENRTGDPLREFGLKLR